VKPIRSDNQIELAGFSAFAGDDNPLPGLLNAIDAVAKNGFDSAFNLAE
jgi:hypothetical protein